MIDDPQGHPMGDPRSDEQLIDAYRKGERNALETLFSRYLAPLHFYLLKESNIKAESFLDDISQEVFLRVNTLLQKGQFTPSGEGSFRAWFYTVAQNVCRTMNRERGKEERSLSSVALSLIPDRVRPTAPADEQEPDRIDKINKQVDEILLKLSPDEQKLIGYLREGKKYRDILSDPLFSKYSLAYLKLKIYNTRRKLVRLVKKKGNTNSTNKANCTNYS